MKGARVERSAQENRPNHHTHTHAHTHREREGGSERGKNRSCHDRYI